MRLEVYFNYLELKSCLAKKAVFFSCTVVTWFMGLEAAIGWQPFKAISFSLCSVSASPSMWARPEYRLAMHAGSCIAWSMASSLMAICLVIRPLVVGMTPSTLSSVRLALGSMCHELCLWIWSLQSLVNGYWKGSTIIKILSCSKPFLLPLKCWNVCILFWPTSKLQIVKLKLACMCGVFFLIFFLSAGYQKDLYLMFQMR